MSHSNRPNPAGRASGAAAALALVLAGPASAARPLQSTGSASTPNILLLIGDDIGVDRVAAYGEHPDPGNTPVLDSLAASGVLFRNAYSNPVCGPSRGLMLSGRYSFRTGWGLGSNYANTPVEYPLEELALPEVLPAGYATAAVGKWHLGTSQLTGLLHPNLTGFDDFWGTTDNFFGYVGDGFFNWSLVENGVTHIDIVEDYATTAEVDRVLHLTQTLPEPWFVWTAFHAPHSPFHKPPQELHSFELPADVAANIPVHVQAAIEALDTEIGRLLQSIDPAVLANTVIIFAGDNGTAPQATTFPFDPEHAKGTVYEGGINVPLIISGPGVAPGAECQGLVSLADLFATIAELAGVPSVSAEDSVSAVPYLADPFQASLRPSVYSEYFEPNGFAAFANRLRAVRNDRYKLIYSYQASTIPQAELYDLLLDPFERIDLLKFGLSAEQQENHDELAALMFEPELSFQQASWALPGALGDPLLDGSGTAAPGQPFGVNLSNAYPSSPAWLVVGQFHASLLFAGGVLAPFPLIVVPQMTDENGSISNTFTWPSGIPAGKTFAIGQYWILDPGAVQGVAATSGLALVSY